MTNARSDGSAMSVRLVAKTKLPTPWGCFDLLGFEAGDGNEHLALTMGDIVADQPVIARLHSECLTGDGFSSLRCDCGTQLELAMATIADEGLGVIVYLRQEGRGIGLINKLRAYALQDEGADTVEANQALGLPADARDFSVAGDILRMLGVRRVRLMTNNPRKISSLQAAGIEVIERLRHRVQPNRYNRFYLETKSRKLGHLA